MSVNEMAMQNDWRHHFPEPGGGGFWDKLAHRGNGFSTLYEFDENYRFFKYSRDYPYDFTHYSIFLKMLICLGLFYEKVSFYVWSDSYCLCCDKVSFFTPFSKE
jgi:hypothetical protein